MRVVLCAMIIAASIFLSCEPKDNYQGYDIVIYGGTSGGVIAAVQAAQMGKKTVLINPGTHLGGLSSGGLGATDIGNKAAIGGLSRGFYRSLGKYYSDPSKWVFQKPDEYSSRRQGGDQDLRWTFEPSIAEMTFDEYMEGSSAELVVDGWLDRTPGATVVENGRIKSIQLLDGRVFEGRMFIDATYEGDLMAAAGVTYIVGRESNDTYGETLDGVQTQNAIYHQFHLPVDPFVEKGKQESGLLPGINPDGPGEEGSGDKKVQAYNFRLCLTDALENRIPFDKPEGFNPLEYELLLRNFEAGFDDIPWINTPMPNSKTDINNRAGASSDFIGRNWDYPEADYETRKKIIKEHEIYQRGLMWVLANDERVPQHVRDEVSRWGYCKDEFTDNNHWPHQIYVRVARRMVGAYVMTQLNCQGEKRVNDPVGLAAYTMDSHNVQRYVKKDSMIVKNEGDVQVGGFPPYPISYRAIIPRKQECSNLLVPVALSASHIAYGSIRMEPVFMVLGQSAATAAAQAIDQKVAVQDIDYPTLKKRLEQDGQRLEYTEEMKESDTHGV